MNNSRKRFALASLGVLLLGYLIYESGPARIASDLGLVGAGLITIVALEFVVDGFNTLGWWFTFPFEVRRGSFSRLYFVRLAGTALNQTLPAASMGGEPAKVLLLRPHFSAATAIATVMTSRLIFGLSKAGFIAFGTMVSWRRFQLPHAFSVAVLVGFIVTLFGTLVFLALQLRGFTAATRGILARIPLPSRWRHGIQHLTPGVDEEIIAFYRSRPSDLALAVFSHQLAFFCGVLQVSFLLGWLGLPRDFGTSLAIESFSMLLGFATFVVPDLIGVQEGGKLLAFAALGLPAAAGVTVGIAFRLTSIVGAAAGLLALGTLQGRQRPELVSSERDSERVSLL
jgi:uncharacterized protein (TIRG00374 family)